MSLWTTEELTTANRVFKDDPVNREKFLNNLLKLSKEDREALMKRYNKSFWQQLKEIFLIGADNVGAAATGDPLPGYIPALADTIEFECKLRNDLALTKASLSLGVKSVLLIGGILLIRKL